MIRQYRTDIFAITTLIVLWGLFFWRVLTPIDADSASFKHGDFSAQFVAFGAYQYERMTQGEIPLWNPYNNSGLPFVADTQAAAFYPPRLLTIAFASLTNGWRYHTLMLEAAAHVLLYTLSLYLLIRRMANSVWGGLGAAIIGGYGGYLSGYPPLQLALLEAGVWLPLAVLGIHEATRHRAIYWPPLALTGLALGLSWMAGHPQTSWFLTYLIMAFWGWRIYTQRIRLSHGLIGLVVFGGITFGLTAITFIPGIEYLQYTARAGMGYATKQNGFPLQDLIQFIYPGTVSLFSPLYIGIVGFLLLLYTLTIKHRDMGFWWGVFVFSLLLSFGGNTAFFDAIYNVVPGLRYFRGQERAAYLVANSAAILVGFSLATITHHNHIWHPRAQTVTRTILLIMGAIFGLIALLWLGFPASYGEHISIVTFSLLIMAAAYMLLERIRQSTQASHHQWMMIIALITFELFSVNMGASAVYDDIPPANQLPQIPPPHISTIQTIDTPPPVRVDGFRGLTGNYGSLYNIYDARGISPLYLDGLYQVQQPPFAKQEAFEINSIFWELNAVQYVYSGFDTLPIASTIISQGADEYGNVFLHALENPRPFAHLVYRADIADSDVFARALLHDARYQPRETIILNQPTELTLPDRPPSEQTAIVTDFTPESFTVAVNTPENAILSLAHPHYTGWQATLDSHPVSILRAYGGWTAIEIPAGEHIIQMTYRPRSFVIGGILSIITWGMLVIFALTHLMRSVHSHAKQSTP